MQARGLGHAARAAGSQDVSGIQIVSMGASGAVPSNLEPFADAIGLLAAANAQATAIVMHPRPWQTLSKLKEQTSGNNKPLLQESAGSGSQGISRQIYGVPVYLTSQLSITETQGGSGAVASSAYVYEARQVIAVRRALHEAGAGRAWRRPLREGRARACLRLGGRARGRGGESRARGRPRRGARAEGVAGSPYRRGQRLRHFFHLSAGASLRGLLTTLPCREPSMPR